MTAFGFDYEIKSGIFFQGDIMIYIQLSEKVDAEGFVLLAKSGPPVLCLPENVYRISSEQQKLLEEKNIPFKTLNAKDIPMPKASMVA